MMEPQSYTIEELDPQEWRCTCMFRCLLGMYTAMGGVLVKVTGRRSFDLFYVYDMRAGITQFHCPNCAFLIDMRYATLRAHCPGCHIWRELYVGENGQIEERVYTGPTPYIKCKTCEQRAGIDTSDTPDYNTA